MRLDKFLCEVHNCTRSEAKTILKKGIVKVNGIVIKNADMQIREETDSVELDGKQLLYKRFVYYMLNKPSDVVSATIDNVSKTVMQLLDKEDYRDDIFPVGRLDKDTEGLLLLTNDGALSHNLLSPKKHVDKCYLVTTFTTVTATDCQKLSQGVDIGEDKPTLPASVEVLDEQHILLTIHEGKFHQVKRMLQAVGNQVTALKRITFGPLKLDESLKPGEYRELMQNEIEELYHA